MVKAERNRAGRAATLAVIAATVLLMSSLRPVSAEEARRKIPVSIQKGETYVIADVSQEEGAPGIEVVNNPNALVVYHIPGQIVLLGADTGGWNLDVTLASGEKVTYTVSVSAAAPPEGSLNPGSAPTAIPQ